MKKNLKTIYLICWHIIPALVCLGQAPVNDWYIGHNQVMSMNKNHTISAINKELPATNPLLVQEGLANAFAENGDLLFYTDGETVFNSKGLIIENGAGLFGNFSATQCLIIPTPGSGNSSFFIITSDSEGGDKGVCYSIVENRNGKLRISQKNIPILTSATEKMAITWNAEGTGYWLILHTWADAHFYVYPISEEGVGTPVKSEIGMVYGGCCSAVGHMKVSPDGKTLASAIYDKGIEVYHFDNSTGKIDEVLGKLESKDASNRPYGLEFSNSNQFLYVSSHGSPSRIIQIDLTQDEFGESIIATSPQYHYFRALQMGPDGQIYTNCQDNIGIIENPEKAGDASKYSYNVIAKTTPGSALLYGLPYIIPKYTPESRADEAVHTERNLKDFIPNAFSPNQDGNNDVFRVITEKFLLPEEEITFFELQVFNRNGQKVFETDNAEEGWDGTYQALKLPVDVYIWSIVLKTNLDEEITLKGDLTLTR